MVGSDLITEMIEMGDIMENIQKDNRIMKNRIERLEKPQTLYNFRRSNEVYGVAYIIWEEQSKILKMIIEFKANVTVLSPDDFIKYLNDKGIRTEKAEEVIEVIF